MLLALVCTYPEAETCKSCREGRNPERETLERSINTRLLVRREKGKVETRKEVIVRHIEDAVVTVEV